MEYFKFVLFVSAGVGSILGSVAIIANAFKTGRREDCMSKFNQQQNKSDQLSNIVDLKFEFIEEQQTEIKNQLAALNIKMDRLFEMMNKIPKRMTNGKEE